MVRLSSISQPGIPGLELPEQGPVSANWGAGGGVNVISATASFGRIDHNKEKNTSPLSRKEVVVLIVMSALLILLLNQGAMGSKLKFLPS